MYAVSEGYKKAMKSRVQRFGVSGSITTKTTGTHLFTESNILDGSMSLTNQCCSGDEIQIGTVYTAELTFTLMLEIKRYTLEDADIELHFGQVLSDWTVEQLPAGRYTIGEANWGRSGVEITAYDYMDKFNQPYKSQSVGTPYEYLSLICTLCSVELGSTKEEIEAMPNGTELLGVYPENDIETYRDFLSWISQVLCGYCTMDRVGRLVIRGYGNEPVDSIDEGNRWDNCTFSDFETRYTGLSIVNIKDKTTKYYSVEPDNALTMNLGSNPMLQYGTDEMKDLRIMNILNNLQKVSYVPFTADMIGNPAYDLGDVLRFTGGYGDGTKLFCMTKFTFDYNAKYTMAGVGKNPRLASGKSKVDKNLSGILNSIGTKDIIFYAFTNAVAYTVTNQKKNIIVIDYTSQEGGTAEFKASILLSSAAALPGSGAADVLHTTSAKVSYKLNNKEIETYYPEETYIDGKHILYLYYVMTGVAGNEVNRFEVFLESAGGSIEIGQGQILANVSGQGLAAELGDWDGKLEFSEELPGVALGGLTVGAFAEEVGMVVMVPVGASLTEHLPEITLGGLTVGVFEEEILPRVVVSSHTIDLSDKARMTFHSYYVDTTADYRLRTTYTFLSEEQEIDTGRMCVVDIDTGQFARVDGIEVKK